GRTGTPIPLIVNPQQPSQPQPPTMRTGVMGAPPEPGLGATDTRFPVQRYLVITPLNYPDAALISLTLRLNEGLHNQLPEILATTLSGAVEGWEQEQLPSGTALLERLAMIEGSFNEPLLSAIIEALDYRAAVLHFS